MESLILGEKQLKALISRQSKKTIKQPKKSIKEVLGPKNSSKHSEETLFNVETDIKYEGYVKIEQERIKNLSKLENTKIPSNTNYSHIKNLSSESREKLSLIKPETLGQASRIAGVRSSDIMIIAFTLKK